MGMLKSSPHSEGSSFKMFLKLGKTLRGHVEESNFAMQRTGERSVPAEPCRCLGQHGPRVTGPSAGSRPERSRQHTRDRAQTRGTPDAELRELQVPEAVTGKHGTAPSLLAAPTERPQQPRVARGRSKPAPPPLGGCRQRSPRGARPGRAGAAPLRPFRRARRARPRAAPGTPRAGHSSPNIHFPHFLVKYFCP
ncbi:serine/arginine repetitive matrix protein 3-like isoform X2 [Passer montanus]|uniref:serine/arginine repetitive matrix protein 3-like isoform X1 n=1 Tax=Passer montanus TaxID=9160 RepID=UPI001960B105|nr:serine/arginine repetitive matrix protein 3-like isoform X1 [Passer montanus]XP_039582194.1 serine/arginine repetitive matrix protein 3-like isoform X2 [Passer montanus]